MIVCTVLKPFRKLASQVYEARVRWQNRTSKTWLLVPRWSNLSTWNSSFSDSSSIEVSRRWRWRRTRTEEPDPKEEEPELKEEEEQRTQSAKRRSKKEKQRSKEHKSKETERSEKQRKKGNHLEWWNSSIINPSSTWIIHR